jgi:hypothetical protein
VKAVGGIGKTILAMEFAARRFDYYDHVAWVDCPSSHVPATGVQHTACLFSPGLNVTTAPLPTLPASQFAGGSDKRKGFKPLPRWYRSVVYVKIPQEDFTRLPPHP